MFARVTILVAVLAAAALSSSVASASNNLPQFIGRNIVLPRQITNDATTYKLTGDAKASKSHLKFVVVGARPVWIWVVSE